MSIARVAIARLVLSAAALVNLAVYESYTSVAVIPVPGDVPTIGFGATKGVKMGDRTTPPMALGRLLADVNEHTEGIRKCIYVPLYQNEFDAYSSLAFNIGVSAFCKSTLAWKLNNREYSSACAEILRWDKFRGKTLAGLTKRRRAEYTTCMGVL